MLLEKMACVCYNHKPRRFSALCGLHKVLLWPSLPEYMHFQHTHKDTVQQPVETQDPLSLSLGKRCNLTTGAIDSAACRLFIESSTIIMTSCLAQRVALACLNASQRHWARKKEKWVTVRAGEGKIMMAILSMVK